MSVISATPWAIKGAIGVISDAYPLFGYHKASYIIVVGVLGAVAFALLAALDITSATTAAILLCAFLFTCMHSHLCVAYENSRKNYSSCRSDSHKHMQIHPLANAF